MKPVFTLIEYSPTDDGPVILWMAPRHAAEDENPALALPGTEHGWDRGIPVQVGP